MTKNKKTKLSTDAYDKAKEFVEDIFLPLYDRQTFNGCCAMNELFAFPDDSDIRDEIDDFNENSIYLADRINITSVKKAMCEQWVRNLQMLSKEKYSYVMTFGIKKQSIIISTLRSAAKSLNIKLTFSKFMSKDGMRELLLVTYLKTPKK